MCLCGIFGRLFKEHVLRVRMFNVAAMSVLRFNDLHLSSVVIPKWIYPINKPKRIIQLISVDNVCSFIANGFCHCQWTLDIFVLPLTGFSLVAVFVLNLWKLHFEDNFRQNFCLGFTTAIRYKRMLHSMQMQLLLITNTFFVQTFDIVSVIMFVCDGYYFIKPFECTHTTEHLNQ